MTAMAVAIAPGVFPFEPKYIVAVIPAIPNIKDSI